MYSASIRLTAALLVQLAQPAGYALAHREWSTTGKTDPVGIDMSAYRTAIARRLAAPRAPKGGTPPMSAQEYATAVWDGHSISSPDFDAGKGHAAHEGVIGAIIASRNSGKALELLQSIDHKLDQLLGGAK
jgi:hypothetical protein